jgi:subtilisin family serine protease
VHDRYKMLVFTSALALAVASSSAFARHGGGGGRPHFGHGGHPSHHAFVHPSHGGPHFGPHLGSHPEPHSGPHSGVGSHGESARLGTGTHLGTHPNGGQPHGNGRLGRNRLPVHPFPGEPGFTGVPPRGETRFVANEMIVHVEAGEQQRTFASATRRLGVSVIGSQNLAFLGGTLFHLRIDGGQKLDDVIRAFESEKIGVAQPNYLFGLQEDTLRKEARVSPASPGGDAGQYVVDKLHLIDAHRMASGNGVTVAVIDSRIDLGHPELRGSIPDGQIDILGRPQDQPDEHGTGMAGAIAAHGRILGVAPRARILAIRAFGPNAQAPRRATTEDVVAGIDRAIQKGARIVNMSFAGPYDPALQVVLKKAHDKGVILIAAAGNMGADSQPLYPAADENVIAVTAVDQNDQLLREANRGPHIALAAPGVDVFEATPRASYNFATGTSIAAAHVSGVVALILERAPDIDSARLEEILFSTARDLGPPGRDSLYGYGLVDPYRALNALAANVAAKTSSNIAPNKPVPGI